MKLHIAGRAFIIQNNKVLIIRESSSYLDGTNVGKYDFSGGKANPGENYIDALKREVKEECGLEIEVGRPFFTDEWRPVVNGEQMQIVGVFYICKPMGTNVILGNDHDDYQWILPSDHVNYPLINATKKAFEEYLL